MRYSIEQLDEAKNRFGSWVDRTGKDAEFRRKMLHGVERAWREIDNRDDWLEVMGVGLDGGGGFSLAAPGMLAFPLKSSLAVCTAVPGWSRGWSSVIEDYDVQRVLGWFFHCCRQYVHRSFVAQVLMIAWEQDGSILHPFGSQAIGLFYSPHGVHAPPEDEALAAARRNFLEAESIQIGQTNLIDSPWLRRDFLDPQLHQAVFHFLRAHDLRRSGFEMEAVVAFDCCVQCIGILVTKLTRSDRSLTRAAVVESLDLHRYAATAQLAYSVRNVFGAHPGGWRWWDWGEECEEEDVDQIAQMAIDVIVAGCGLFPDSGVRKPDWARWMFDSFPTLWGVVWNEPKVWPS